MILKMLFLSLVFNFSFIDVPQMRDILLNHIFFYLNEKDLKNIALTSKKCNVHVKNFPNIIDSKVKLYGYFKKPNYIYYWANIFHIPIYYINNHVDTFQNICDEFSIKKWPNIFRFRSNLKDKLSKVKYYYTRNPRYPFRRNNVCFLITQFNNLTHLTLSNCEMKIFPPFLYNLEHIRVLSLEKNLFPIIPQDLSHFKYLKIVNLRDNPITYFPLNVDFMVNWECLDLKNTLICFIPNSIFNMSHLDSFRICGGYKKKYTEKDLFINYNCIKVPKGFFPFIKKKNIKFCSYNDSIIEEWTLDFLELSVQYIKILGIKYFLYYIL